MNWTSTAVIQKESHWAVQAASTAGEAAELECTSEAQARYFAAVLSLGPAKLPKALIMKRLGELNRDEGITSAARATARCACAPLSLPRAPAG